MSIVAPGSTLAVSPAFIGAVDEATSEFADCQTFAAALNERVTSGVADVVGKFSAGVEGISEVEQLREVCDQVLDDDIPGKKAAARNLIKQLRMCPVIY